MRLVFEQGFVEKLLQVVKPIQKLHLGVAAVFARTHFEFKHFGEASVEHPAHHRLSVSVDPHWL